MNKWTVASFLHYIDFNSAISADSVAGNPVSHEALKELQKLEQHFAQWNSVGLLAAEYTKLEASRDAAWDKIIKQKNIIDELEVLCEGVVRAAETLLGSDTTAQEADRLDEAVAKFRTRFPRSGAI